jgi:hypothetical protein
MSHQACQNDFISNDENLTLKSWIVLILQEIVIITFSLFSILHLLLEYTLTTVPRRDYERCLAGNHPGRANNLPRMIQEGSHA